MVQGETLVPALLIGAGRRVTVVSPATATSSAARPSVERAVPGREIMLSTAEVGRPAVPPPSPRVSAVDKAAVAEEKIRLGQLRNEVADLEVRALLISS